MMNSFTWVHSYQKSILDETKCKFLHLLLERKLFYLFLLMEITTIIGKISHFCGNTFQTCQKFTVQANESLDLLQ